MLHRSGADNTRGKRERFCTHIRPFAGALADDTPSHGVIGWLVRAHVAQCPACQAALAALQTIRERLRALATESAPVEETTLGLDRWTTLESAWAEVERRRSDPPSSRTGPPPDASRSLPGP